MVLRPETEIELDPALLAALEQQVNEFDTIPKLAALYTMGTEDDWTGDCEYIICKGGRGGGKSESIAQALISIAMRESTRILCCREIQNTMKDSVHKILKEWIVLMGVEKEFKVTNDTIVNLITGTDFIFMGMESAASDRSDSLKSLKGVKYVWYEEAQTATIASLEKLDPTIRIDGRKIIFSMNPRNTSDAVPVFIKSYCDPKKVLTITVNYQDNQFCPDVLINQANTMKELDYDRWLHIWQGIPLPEDSSQIILPYSWLSQCIDLHKKHDLPGMNIDEPYKLRDYKTVGGFDVADGTTTAHDKNALGLRKGPVVTHCEEWQIDQVYKSVAHINRRQQSLGFTRLWYDAVAVGVAAKSEFDRLDKTILGGLGYPVYAFKGSRSPQGKDVPFTGQGKNKITNAAMFANCKAQSWWNLRLRLENSMKLLRGEEIDRKDYYLSFSSDIEGIDAILLELAQATFEEDNSGRIKVDKAPGIHTVVIEGKDKERKSPNKADAIVYSFADDLARGLQAHQSRRKKVKVIG